MFEAVEEVVGREEPEEIVAGVVDVVELEEADVSIESALVDVVVEVAGLTSDEVEKAIERIISCTSFLNDFPVTPLSEWVL